MNNYLLGNQVTLTGRFYSDAAKTTPADPTTVVLSIRDPNRVVTTPTPAHPGLGIYTYAWTPTVAGMYEANWTGTGAVVSAEQEPVYINVGISLGQLYLSPDQLKSTLSMSGTSFADADLTLAIGAASRAVDAMTGRRFWLDADANQVRYYTPSSYRVLDIDDVVTVTSIGIDRSANGSYTEAWVSNADYVLEPFNAPTRQPPRPYERLRSRRLSGRGFPFYIEQSVKITGRFGWSSIPDDVVAATSIMAAKLLRRSREAPFGIVSAGIDQGTAMRISRTDPDVFTLLSGYMSHIF